ncbi:luciferase family protein [uncultured Roseibium sp.]|uniref:luciferase domain-containing protein n=1 Tax=uncultured Roseibium sp. TaxID=1936171 RepID=UPI002619167C|nr:luciferase family protein [uncultured Roseibium sp.]
MSAWPELMKTRQIDHEIEMDCNRMKNGFGRTSCAVAILLLAGLFFETARAGEDRLPQREGEVPRTTSSVPHIQIGAQAVPELSDRLLERVAKIPGVELRATVISLPGAKGFWLNEDVKLARPQAIVGGREFAHLHPDGSLHASLPPERAQEAVRAGWATMHPWANQRPGWQGFVLIFTPQSSEEVNTVFGLVLDGYNYVTGADYLPQSF